MTEEIKTCDCKEKALKVVKEVSIIAGGVFVGATLAILLSAQILKPKCPCPRGMMMPPPPAMERQLPPPPMMDNHFQGAPDFQGPRPDFRGPQRPGEFQGPRPDFRGPQPPQGEFQKSHHKDVRGNRPDFRGPRPDNHRPAPAPAPAAPQVGK